MCLPGFNGPSCTPGESFCVRSCCVGCLAALSKAYNLAPTVPRALSKARDPAPTFPRAVRPSCLGALMLWQMQHNTSVLMSRHISNALSAQLHHCAHLHTSCQLPMQGVPRATPHQAAAACSAQREPTRTRSAAKPAPHAQPAPYQRQEPRQRPSAVSNTQLLVNTCLYSTQQQAQDTHV